ncbi:hypothetical protein pdam_00013159 [Pocillopora damicornis]|uniref:Uncharacterized protein n=1 Tax=Pocillopora damicornis TaxID=46731 RepID=A0A3M6UKF4_POCDA|nr:hypothetical protein pdam_00013159 [Pocillopora damicornis]
MRASSEDLCFFFQNVPFIYDLNLSKLSLLEVALSFNLLAYFESVNCCLKLNFRRSSILRSFWLLLVFLI